METLPPTAPDEPNPESETVPEFLINQKLLELILEEDVESFSVKLGSAAGDNFMSVINAVEVHFRAQGQPPRHILLKCYPNQVARRGYLDDTDLFGTEFFFYDEWAPKLEQLVADNPNLRINIPNFLGGNRAGVGRNKSGPVTYPSPWTNENFIVMSDLRREGGLKMANRSEGVDVNHSILIVQQLATMHALSWVFKQRNNIDKLTHVYPDMIDKTYSSTINEAFVPLMDSVTNQAMSHIETEFGSDSPIFLGVKNVFSKDIMDILKKFVNHEGIVERDMESMLRVREEMGMDFITEPWLVACHGDCWTNNVLFKYDKDTVEQKKPTKVVLLDFQIVHEGCPTSDLAYFFYSSTTTETRNSSEDTILKAYYDQFMLVCDLLHCKPLPGFSWTSLKRRFRRAKTFGFVMGVFMLTIMTSPAEEAVDLETIKGDMNDVFSSVMEVKDDNFGWKDRISKMAKEMYDHGIF